MSLPFLSIKTPPLIIRLFANMNIVITRCSNCVCVVIVIGLWYTFGKQSQNILLEP